MNICGPLFKNCEEFQDGDNRVSTLHGDLLSMGSCVFLQVYTAMEGALVLIRLIRGGREIDLAQISY